MKRPGNRRKTCEVCGEHKSVPATIQKGVDPKDFLADPYCSRACCEADHGITNSGIAHSGSPRKEVAA